MINVFVNQIILVTCNVTRYIMIKQFRHKGLRQFFESGRVTGILPTHASRLREILALLNTADRVEDMNLPGLHLHELKGNRTGIWSVRVSGNWCVTFSMDSGDVYDVNYEDYH